MADLNALSDKLVKEEITVGYDTYVDASEFPPPIPEGIYTFVQGKATFSVTAGGYLQAQMEHEVAEGEQAGKKIAFDRISNKPFERNGVKVNMMTDHLRAVGNTDRLSSHQQFADAIEAAEGKPFKAQVAWEGGCNHAGTEHEVEWSSGNVYRVKGARSFPADGNGGHTNEIVCPKCGQTVIARARISRRIPLAQA